LQADEQLLGHRLAMMKWGHHHIQQQRPAQGLLIKAQT